MEHSNSSKFSAGGLRDERLSMVCGSRVTACRLSLVPNSPALRSCVIDVIENASEKPCLVRWRSARWEANRRS